MKVLKISMKPSPERRLYEEVMQQCKQLHLLSVEELGEGMAAAYDSRHIPRYILDNQEKTAFEFESSEGRLTTVQKDNIERWSFNSRGWSDINISWVNNLQASSSIRIEPFRNGIARVAWVVQEKGHDGYYWMDEDGFGMEDEREIIIYGYINKKGKVVGNFREPAWDDCEDDYRLQAENNERTGVVEGAYVVFEEKRKRISAILAAEKAMKEKVSKMLSKGDRSYIYYDIGEEMVEVKGENQSFVIGNLLAEKARQFVSVEGVLIVDDSEVDIDAIKRNCHHYCGRNSIEWIGSRGFKNGVCAIIWDIYCKDGEPEEKAFCIINKDLEIVEPFRPIVKTDDIEKALEKY